MLPHDYCHNKIAPRGSSYYYSLLYTAEEKRNAIVALLAFSQHINDIRFECSDLALAQQKLQWWRTEIVKLFADEPSHPVTQALHPCIKKFSLSPALFFEIIDHAETEQRPFIFENFSQLTHYYFQAPSVTKLITTYLLADNKKEITEFSHHLDVSLRVVDHIYQFRKMLLFGFIFLPKEDLLAHQLKENDLLQLKSSAALSALLKKYSSHAKNFYQQALKTLSMNERKHQLFNLIYTELQMKLLSEIEKDGFDVFHNQILLTPLRKYWIAWRISLSEY